MCIRDSFKYSLHSQQQTRSRTSSSSRFCDTIGINDSSSGSRRCEKHDRTCTQRAPQQGVYFIHSSNYFRLYLEDKKTAPPTFEIAITQHTSNRATRTRCHNSDNYRRSRPSPREHSGPDTFTRSMPQGHGSNGRGSGDLQFSQASPSNTKSKRYGLIYPYLQRPKHLKAGPAMPLKAYFAAPGSTNYGRLTSTPPGEGFVRTCECTEPVGTGAGAVCIEPGPPKWRITMFNDAHARRPPESQ